MEEMIRVEIRTVSGMTYLHNIEANKYGDILDKYYSGRMFCIDEGSESSIYNSRNIERIKRVNI